jgi:hypothetical protein
MHFAYSNGGVPSAYISTIEIYAHTLQKLGHKDKLIYEESVLKIEAKTTIPKYDS